MLIHTHRSPAFCSTALCALLVLAALPRAAVAQFTDPFNAIDPAWVPNRYDPAGFNSVMFDGDNRLQLTISDADSTAHRPIAFSDPFYDIQGRQRDGGIAGQWTLSAQVYVASTFNTTTGPLVATELWGHSGTTPGGGAYMILGFTNASPTDALNPAAPDRIFRFHAYDFNSGHDTDLGVPNGFIFDTWHELSGTSNGTAFAYRIDGVLVQTIATSEGNNLLSAMI